jgi:GNAT superfamily N-acetyltransferase
MPFLVDKVTKDDIEELIALEYCAFKSASPLVPVFYPNGYGPSTLRKRREKFQTLLDNPDCTILKVADSDNNGRLVSVGIWKIIKEEKQEEKQDLAVPKVATDTGPLAEELEENTEVMREYETGITKLKDKCVTPLPHIYLSMLVTHPEYHRRGAGKLLLEKLAEQADKEGLPTTLIASAVGYSLYARQGYSPVEGAEARFDLSKWGVNATVVNTLMERLPNSKTKR